MMNPWNGYLRSSGVPQDFLLGFILFLSYSNVIENGLKSITSQPADDVEMEATEYICVIQKDLDKQNYPVVRHVADVFKS